MRPRIQKALRAAATPFFKAVDAVHNSMPPADHIDDPIPTVKESTTRRHWVVAIATSAALYISLLTMSIMGKGSWILQNPITSVGKGLSALTGSKWPATIASMLVMVLVMLFLFYLFAQKPKGEEAKEIEARGHTDRMEAFVLNEERIYREGAENWRWHQRIWACFLFGLIHVLNLIVPYAVVLMLAVGGGVFMHEYLRVMKQTGSRQKALGASTALHYCYNTASFFGLPVYILAHIAAVLIQEF
jgi:hypothetical protein